MACAVAPGTVWRIFGGDNGSKQPAEICRALADSIEAGGDTSDASDRSEELTGHLRGVLALLRPPTEDQEAIPTEEYKTEQKEIVQTLLSNDTPARLLANLDALNFEAKKDAMKLFTFVLQLGGELNMQQQIVKYVKDHRLILQLLLDGSGSANLEVATNCALMLRACCRYPDLVEYLLEARVAIGLVDLTRDANFEISADAFCSLRELLLTHKDVSSRYLESNFKEFFDHFNELLKSGVVYTTQRQALRLLGEILLDRGFVRVMLNYVGNDQFLQFHMNLLRDTAKSIKIESFHVFKIFAANPNKPPKVQLILHRNKDRLVKLLETFRQGRETGDVFIQDLTQVVNHLKKLEAPAGSERSQSKGAAAISEQPKDAEAQPLPAPSDAAAASESA